MDEDAVSADNHGFPRAPLIGAGALLLGVTLLVALLRVSGVGPSYTTDLRPVSVRELSFADESDGSIAVYDENRQLLARLEGTHGFLRGTLRGFARERKRMAIGPAQPFRLIGRADGQLSLEDPSTRRHVDLGAFGPTNAKIFAQLLVARSAQRSISALAPNPQ
jgi:putative photosynthetic complex assembly protein